METATGTSDRRILHLPGGAALVGPADVWVLAPPAGDRSLGPALVIARAADPGVERQVHVVVDADDDTDPGVLARRAGAFARPATVWRADGRDLVAVSPVDRPPSVGLADNVLAFTGTLVAAGAEPVVEHGRLIGEVLGLEVARVVADADGARLEIGVGRFDREAHALVSTGNDPVDTLRRVVELVRAIRRDSTTHPLARLAQAGRLRSRLEAEPSLVGAAQLAPLPSVAEAPDLRTAWPSAAVGTDLDGRPLVVVASVGVDLDLVPEAADIRAAAGPGHRLVLAVPPRDVHRLTEALAGDLADPADLVGVPA